MSKAKELLLECKIKLGVQSDYKLAQAIGIHRARVSAYMHGKEHPDPFTAVRMALILQRDPAELIAEIELEKEKNEKRQEFWRDFILHAKRLAKRGMLVLICTISLQAGFNASEAGNRFFRSRRFA
jgi:transcriptional regulator with XRE-family HTH domain